MARIVMPEGASARKRQRIALEANVQEVIQLARAFCESGKELWRRVPWLALEADVRPKHFTHLSTAYRSGLWPIPSIIQGHCNTFVDCETGALVSGCMAPLNERHLLAISSNIDLIDAVRVVAELERIIREVPHPAGHDPSWKKGVAEMLGLAPVYVRRNPPKYTCCYD